jgi:hypothetical protein
MASKRVTCDDLATAELAVRHEAETYNEGDEATEQSLLRVADWLFTQRQQRYRRMAYRTMPDALGYRQATPRPALPQPGEQHG